MGDLLLFFGLLWAAVLLLWPALVLLHELGHALPALLFTRAPVTVYLGSYGDSSNCWRVRAGGLTLYGKRTWFWRGGLCVPTRPAPTKVQTALILLGGTVMSLAVTALGFYGALAFDLHGALKLVLFLLTLLATVALVTNLTPSDRSGMANDGLLLKQLLTGRPAPAVVFAPELQALLTGAQLIAVRLGCDQVSSLHLFLADAFMPYPYSLANLFFPTPAARRAFYEQQRMGPAGAADQQLPCTAELEQALHLASLTRWHGLCAELYPAHLLLAASGVPGSALAQALPAPATLPQRLLAYYRPFDELWAR